jgi:hypothetical protein
MCDHFAFPSAVAVATLPSPGTDDFNNGECGDQSRTFSSRIIHSDVSLAASSREHSAAITSPTSIRSFQQHSSFSGSPDYLHTTDDQSAGVIGDSNDLPSAIQHNSASDIVASRSPFIPYMVSNGSIRTVTCQFTLSPLTAVSVELRLIRPETTRQKLSRTG